MDLLPLPSACAQHTQTPIFTKLNSTKASWKACPPTLSSATDSIDSKPTIKVLMVTVKKCIDKSIKIGQLKENKPRCAGLVGLLVSDIIFS